MFSCTFQRTFLWSSLNAYCRMHTLYYCNNMRISKYFVYGKYSTLHIRANKRKVVCYRPNLPSSARRYKITSDFLVCKFVKETNIEREKTKGRYWTFQWCLAVWFRRRSNQKRSNYQWKSESTRIPSSSRERVLLSLQRTTRSSILRHQRETGEKEHVIRIVLTTLL